MSLVNETDVEHFVSELRRSYAGYQGLSPEALKEAIFATKPSSGAGGEPHTLRKFL